MGSEVQPPALAADLSAYRYPDGTHALHELSLQVSSGSFCAVLGGNGSGKTTLLKVLDGMFRDYQGSVRLEGEEISRLTPRQIYSRMGLVFQNPDEQLFGHSVYEDVAFGPRNMGFDEPEVRRRVKAALAEMELVELERRDLHTLSYGQKKRVCIAGLLAMGHRILLLDEPSAGLDPRGERHLMELLARLNRESGVTVVMATHQVDLVPLYFDRLFLLAGGRLVLSGAPQEVLLDPVLLEAECLRLPYVGELFHALRSAGISAGAPLPLTVADGVRRLQQECSK